MKAEKGACRLICSDNHFCLYAAWCVCCPSPSYAACPAVACLEMLQRAEILSMESRFGSSSSTARVGVTTPPVRVPVGVNKAAGKLVRSLARSLVLSQDPAYRSLGGPTINIETGKLGHMICAFVLQTASSALCCKLCIAFAGSFLQLLFWAAAQ